MKRYIIAAAFALTLGACAQTVPGEVPIVTSARQELSIAHGVYTGLQITLIAYQAFPPCTQEGVGKLCYDLNSGQVANRALLVLKNALDALDAGLAAFNTDKTVDVVALTTAVVKAAVAVSQAAALFSKSG